MAVFNLAHGLDQMLWRRLKNEFDEIKNLYLVGRGTHPGSGLPVIYESARISSKLILDSLGIRPDWNGVDTWFASRKRRSKANNQLPHQNPILQLVIQLNHKVRECVRR